MVKDPFTVHTVFPGIAGAVVGGLTFAAIKSYYNQSGINKNLYWYPKFNAVVCFLTSFAGYYIIKVRLMKAFRIVAFSPPAGSIGIKQVPGRRDINRPPMSVFYTCHRTNSSMNSKEMNTRVAWLPNNGDLRYNDGMAMFMTEVMGSLPGLVKQVKCQILCFLFRHWSHAEIEVVSNAPPSLERLLIHAPQASERTPARIVILCHGMGGHQHIHSDLVLRHLAALPGGSGVVVCPNFTEGSSGFCLRDERDVVGSTFKECHHHMSFSTEPGEALIKMREDMLLSRVQQINEVMKFVGSREERGHDDGAGGAGGGLTSLLFPGDQDKQLQFLDKISSPISSKVEIRLIGHSFGASAVIASALKKIDGDGSVRVQSVCALDTWMTPLQHCVVEELEQAQSQQENQKPKKQSERLPPLHLIDSEQWDRWKYNKQLEERLVQAWPGTVSRDATSAGSDHLTALDFSMMIPAVGARNTKYVKAEDDESFRRKWASKCVVADDRFQQ